MEENNCAIIRHKDAYDVDEYAVVHHWWDLSCGHTVLTDDEEQKPKYCTECGCKVIPYEELIGNLKDAINEQGHIIQMESKTITEQTSRVKWIADREQIVGYEFKAYCNKCGLGKTNYYQSELEAMKALFEASRGIKCSDRRNFESSDLEYLRNKAIGGTSHEQHFDMDEVVAMSDERLPIALGFAKEVQANIEREMKKRNLETE